MERESRLRSFYAAFNARDIETALAAMTPDVDWPNGWEGGRVIGRENVRDYWERQWAAIEGTVEPIGIAELADGTTEVTVRQVVRDLTGSVVFDGEVRHVYSFRGALVRHMAIDP